MAKASLGASALLVFALPQSPMSQPWAMIAGNTLSALVGITIFHFIDQSLLAITLAVSLSILGMSILHCLHPPAAVALIAVLGRTGSYQYALSSVMVDPVKMILVGAAFSNVTGKRYPNKPREPLFNFACCDRDNAALDCVILVITIVFLADRLCALGCLIT